MAIGWFIVPYKRRIGSDRPTRYVAIDDQTATILADGGKWSETEVLGNQAIVKVRASVNTLQTLAGLYTRIPKDALDDSLASLTSGQKNALKNILQTAGYDINEINSRFPGNLGDYTVRDVLVFLASRRLKPRYDAATDTIHVDGVVQNCKPVQNVDEEVV